MFSLVKANGLGAFHLFDAIHIVPCDVEGSVVGCEYVDSKWRLAHTFHRTEQPAVILFISARPGSIRAEVGRPELSVRVFSDSAADFPVLVCEAATLAAKVYESCEEGAFDPANYESVPPASARNPKHSLWIDGFVVEIFRS